MPTLKTLATLAGAPYAGLVADAAGDLFGVTFTGGPAGDGTIFEIAKTAQGYASTPTTLISFNGQDGSDPEGALIVDAAGDLFGTTTGRGFGGSNAGTVFELAKTADGYANAPTTLATFNGANGSDPEAGLVEDAAGDLFGTTASGPAGTFGTVFEVTKTANGYATAPTTLVAFNGVDGTLPQVSLITDAAGDLFGETGGGGTGFDGSAFSGDGTVFEIAKTADGYASQPTTLVSFNGANGNYPHSNLITDAAGDLFGTTSGGQTSGTVFEIAKTPDGYANTATTLASLGNFPQAGLIADAAGDLFGTTSGEGGSAGTVFELAKTADGYATSVTTLGADGGYIQGGLIADAAGNLFSTSEEGPSTPVNAAFEITGAGFATRATFTFTTGVDDLVGWTGADTFVATSKTLGKGDVAVGGTGANVLELQGGGVFDLALPTTLSGVPIVDAQEGVGAARQTITLRSGLNVTVNVASGSEATAGTTIIGANDASVINLGDGTDTVIVGGSGETIVGGGGADRIKVTGVTIGATIDGGAGASVLELTSKGSATMGPNITNIRKVKLDKDATFTANVESGLTIVGNSGADTIIAGGSGQTLTGGGGADILTGYSGGGDIFRDTAAHLALATIQDFVAGDTIDITTLRASKRLPTTATWADGVLSLSQGATTDQITLPGDFTGTFTSSPDGNGGADITYAAAAPTLLTQAMASFGAGATDPGLASTFAAHGGPTPMEIWIARR